MTEQLRVLLGTQAKGVEQLDLKAIAEAEGLEGFAQGGKHADPPDKIEMTAAEDIMSAGKTEIDAKHRTSSRPERAGLLFARVQRFRALQVRCGVCSIPIDGQLARESPLWTEDDSRV